MRKIKLFVFKFFVVFIPCVFCLCTTKFEYSDDASEWPEGSEGEGVSDGETPDTIEEQDQADADISTDDVEEEEIQMYAFIEGEARVLDYANPMDIDLDGERASLQALVHEDRLYVLSNHMELVSDPDPKQHNILTMDVWDIPPAHPLSLPSAPLATVDHIIVETDPATPYNPIEDNLAMDVDADGMYIYVFQNVAMVAPAGSSNVRVMRFSIADQTWDGEELLFTPSSDIGNIHGDYVRRCGSSFQLLLMDQVGGGLNVIHGVTIDKSAMERLFVPTNRLAWASDVAHLTDQRVIFSTHLACVQGSIFVGFMSFDNDNDLSASSISAYSGNRFTPGPGILAPDFTIDLCTTGSCSGEEPRNFILPTLHEALPPSEALICGWVTNQNPINLSQPNFTDPPFRLHAGSHLIGDSVVSAFNSEEFGDALFPVATMWMQPVESDKMLVDNSNKVFLTTIVYDGGPTPAYVHVAVYPLDFYGFRPMVSPPPVIVDPDFTMEMPRFYGFDSVIEPASGTIYLVWNRWQWNTSPSDAAITIEGYEIRPVGYELSGD